MRAPIDLLNPDSSNPQPRWENLMVAGPVARSGSSARPWSVDRWGRLLSGTGTLLLLGLSWLVSPLWMIGIVLLGLNLLVTSLTDSCVLHRILTKLGAREREDLFAPGGASRIVPEGHSARAP